ncbi:MAG: MFS transporter [Oscillospiraceae bacterium]
MAKEKKYTRPESSWIMYDWANSVYATIIMAAIFPTYFASIAPQGDVWWAWGTSLATLVIAVLAPILGAIADYKGLKKKLFSTFLIIGLVFTTAMAFTDNWKLILVGYVISYIGYAGSCLFYDSFITDVTTPERMDKVSAMGYSMGYIGGSTIPFLLSIVLINFVFADNIVLAVKISVVITTLWWAIFSIPFLKNASQTHDLGAIPKHFLKATFKNIGKTFTSIFKKKALLFFVLAYFFYIDGVGTVIHMSTAYGSTLGLNTTGMILALLVTQLVAAPCSILFAKFADKIGSIKMLGIAVGIYFLICSVGFYMGFSLEPSQMSSEKDFTAAFSLSVPEAETKYDALLGSCLSSLNNTDRDTEIPAIIDEANIDSADASAIKSAVAPVLSKITDSGEYDSALHLSNILFWAMAVLVGTCQGGIQALSRSYFGKLIPPEKSNEYFGFFDIFGKFAAVMGPALYAVTKTITGRSSYGILSLMLLFMIGALMLFLGRKHFKEAENSRQTNA